MWSPSGVVWWRAQGAVLVLITALYALAWVLLGWSMLNAGLGLQTAPSAGPLCWAGGDRAIPDAADGLFRLTRQPICVSFARTLWTVAVWTPDQLVVAVVLTAYCVVRPWFQGEGSAGSTVSLRRIRAAGAVLAAGQAGSMRARVVLRTSDPRCRPAGAPHVAPGPRRRQDRGDQHHRST